MKTTIFSAAILAMLPSLRYNFGYNDKTDKTPLSPILGTGAQVSYSHFTAGCVFYSVKKSLVRCTGNRI